MWHQVDNLTMGLGMEVIGFVSRRESACWWYQADDRNVIDFSSVLTKGQIEDMATADEFEVVKEVQVSTVPVELGTSWQGIDIDIECGWPQEYFADYLPHYPSLVTMSSALLADGMDDPPNVGSLFYRYYPER